MRADIGLEIERRTGITEGATVALACDVVVRSLRPFLGPSTRAAVREALGTDGGDPNVIAAGDPPFESIAIAVADACALGHGRAIELVESIFVTLARALGIDARKRLAIELPPSWAARLDDPHAVARDRRGAPPVVAPVGAGHTLASGRPGASETLAEGAPHAAHSQSIAADDDPHAATRLASSRGISSERDGRSLADAGPRRGRPYG